MFAVGNAVPSVLLLQQPKHTLMDIKIISGTDRPDSNSLLFSNFLKGEYARHGVEAEVISLEKFPMMVSLTQIQMRT